MKYTDKIMIKENRNLAPLPNVFITNEAFPKKMDGFINDRIGLRQELLDIAEIYPVLQGANNVGISSLVISGDDDWLFYNMPTTNENIKDFIKIDTYTPANLEKMVAAFKEINDWCISHGITLIVMVPPIKHNIYPEYYNKAYIQLDRPTRYELLRDALEKNGITFLDLRSALLEAKKIEQTYYKSDTHWNHFSGGIAYSILIDKIEDMGGKVHKYNKDQFRIIELDEYYQGDLQRMCLGCSVKNTDKVTGVEFNEARTINNIELVQQTDSRVTSSIQESGREGLAKIFVVHDSFFYVVEPFLVRSVSRMMTRWEWGISPLKYADIIIEEKPDFLIWEMHEPYLLKILDGSYNSSAEFVQKTKNATK